MTPRLWSISALAVELGLDRRTVAARLRDVPAAGGLHGKPAWRLTDALAALEGGWGVAGPAAPERPPGYEAVEGLENPFDQGALMALLTVTYELPRQAAVVAADAGLPMAGVYELTNLLTLCVMGLIGGSWRFWPGEDGEALWREEGF